MQLFGNLSNDLAVWKEAYAPFHGDLRALISRGGIASRSLRPLVLAAIVDRGLELIIDVYFEPKNEAEPNKPLQE